MTIRNFVAPAVVLLLIEVNCLAQDSSHRKALGLAAAAIERTEQKVKYDGSYRAIDYPNGDVPKDTGVCTDLVVRSYRKIGIDLQRLVHEDMNMAFGEYPQKWNATGADANIDHRRVPNLQTFFERRGARLPIGREAADFLPGDVVTWMLSGHMPHIGIVTNKMQPGGGPPLIAHNIGAGPELQDMLFEYEITGHYRFYVAD